MVVVFHYLNKTSNFNLYCLSNDRSMVFACFDCTTDIINVGLCNAALWKESIAF